MSLTSFEQARREARLIVKRVRPYFQPICPECSHKNWHDAKTCAECGARLYPTLAQIENVRRDHEAA